VVAADADFLGGFKARATHLNWQLPIAFLVSLFRACNESVNVVWPVDHPMAEATDGDNLFWLIGNMMAYQP
jgi:hypothetical protein